MEKSKSLRKESLKVDNREKLKELCAKKKHGFFEKLGGKLKRDEVEIDKNTKVKRKREGDDKCEEDNEKKRKKQEDNRKETAKKSDASLEMKVNHFQWGKENVKRKAARNEMSDGRASPVKIPGGKVTILKKTFESKNDLSNLRGQGSCLASASNEKAAYKLTASHLIGGDFEAKARRANEMQD